LLLVCPRGIFNPNPIHHATKMILNNNKGDHVQHLDEGLRSCHRISSGNALMMEVYSDNGERVTLSSESSVITCTRTVGP
jgi:hypothetical protein